MKSIFAIAESANYEKHVLFNYPLTNEFFEYLSQKYLKERKSNPSENDINSINSSKDFSDFELYLKLFTLDNHVNQNFIFDIIIDKDRFISFPIWFSKNEYNKREIIEKEKEKENLEHRININNLKKSINKTEDKYILLNMFNIVFVFSNDKPMNVNRELFKSVYSNLESLSKLLQFEEYNKHYLGFETWRIIKIKKRFFMQKKESINYKEFLERFPKNNNFFKYIKGIYEGIEKSEISNVIISNIELNYYIGMYTNQISSNKVKPYHCIIINNRKKLDNFFQSMKDINPKILIIIDKIFQMKTLEEISLEKNIELNFILFFVNQLVSWNLAKLIFKFNNYSMFQISESIPEINSNYKLQELKIGFNTIIDLLNKFSTSESTTTLNEIFQTTNSIDIDEFKRCLRYFVENNFLVQTSIIIISKLKMKQELNYKESMINKFNSMLNNEINNNKVNKKINSINNDNKGIIYFENFLELVKDKSMEDFIILANIKNLISSRLYINEISYYTGYKIKDILNVVNKYEAVFDLVVVPL